MRIPERTVDFLVAVEVARLAPSSIISSPTNTKGSVDHIVRQDLSLMILECKGVITATTPASETYEILAPGTCLDSSETDLEDFELE